MLTRQLEPEVMDSPEEASDYDAMDHAHVNRVFVEDFLRALIEPRQRLWELGPLPRCLQEPLPPLPPLSEDAGKGIGALRILDVGTGTAQIPIELCRRGFMGAVTAIDLAKSMLELARHNVAVAGFSDHIDAQFVDAKRLPYPDRSFNAVMSNSIVHHIPDPLPLLAEAKRVLRRGGAIFIRDLLRPRSSDEVEQIVAMYAGEESPRQQQLFRQSLHAALSLNEVYTLLATVGLPRTFLRQTSDRHWTIAGKV